MQKKQSNCHILHALRYLYRHCTVVECAAEFVTEKATSVTASYCLSHESRHGILCRLRQCGFWRVSQIYSFWWFVVVVLYFCSSLLSLASRVSIAQLNEFTSDTCKSLQFVHQREGPWCLVCHCLKSTPRLCRHMKTMLEHFQMYCYIWTWYTFTLYCILSISLLFAGCTGTRI